MTIRHLIMGILMVLGAVAGVSALDSFMESREADKHTEYKGSVAPE